MRIRRALAACCVFVAVASGHAFAQEPQRLEPGPAPADGIDALVVDAESGEPVANALVTWFAQGKDFWPRVLPEPQLEAERIEHGRTAATDAKGVTKIGRGDLIVASAGDRYAARRWNRGIESPMKFTLKRARRIDVVVVDGTGKPVAGAPLSLSGNAGSQSQVSSWQIATGADGKASFAPLDLFLDFELRTRHEFHLRVDAPLGDRGDRFERRLDDRSLPDDPTTFTLPPTGTVVLEVVDDKGEPSSGVHDVTIVTLPAGSTDEPFDELEKSWVGSEWSRYDEQSRYEVRCVALARRLRIDCDDGPWNRSRQTLDGPTKPGERVSGRIVLARRKQLRVVATILGVDSRPLADSSLTANFVLPGRTQTESDGSPAYVPPDARLPIEARTDASGRAEWRRDDGWKSDDLATLEQRIARVEIEQTGPTGVVAVARRDFPPATGDGVHDLGSLVLVATPRFVSGRVVDDAGNPVARACVTVTAVQRPKPGARMVLGSSGPRRYDQSFAGESAADGTFVLFALPLPDSDFEIAATPPQGVAYSVADPEYERFGGRRVAVGAGDRDVELTLSRVGTIAGSIVGDADEIARLGYHLALRPTVSAASSQSGGIGGAEFSLEGIPVGVATLQLRDKGGHSVARVADIVVRAGEVTRLPPIVLGEARHSLVLTIRDELGQPIANGWVARPASADQPDPLELARKFLTTMAPEGSGIDIDDLPMDALRAPSVTPFRDGTLSLHGNDRFRSLAVGAPGCASEMLHDAEGAATVTLRAAPRVALVLDLDGDPPKEGKIEAALVPRNDDDEWFRFGPSTTVFESGFGGSEDGKPVALVPGSPIGVFVCATGEARVRLAFAEKPGTGSLGMPLRCDPRTVIVTASRELQVFHIRVSTEALKAATAPPAKNR